MTQNFESECFFISPIGAEDSDVRKRANGVMKAVVEPAAAAHGLSVVRADQVSEPGTITLQIVEHLTGARAVVADLTENNANVFYELAIREAAQKPVVVIAESNTEIPFDKAQDRAMFFDSTDLASVWEAHDKLAEFLGASLEGKMMNPIASAMVWKEYSASDKPVEQAVAQLAEQVSQVAADVQRLSRQPGFSFPLATNYFKSGGGGAISPTAATGPMMSQYDYLHGYVPNQVSAEPNQRLRFPQYDQSPKRVADDGEQSN
jgi:hypothetical protein